MVVRADGARLAAGVGTAAAGGACGVLYDGGDVSVSGHVGVLGGAVSGAVVCG